MFNSIDSIDQTQMRNLQFEPLAFRESGNELNMMMMTKEIAETNQEENRYKHYISKKTLTNNLLRTNTYSNSSIHSNEESKNVNPNSNFLVNPNLPYSNSIYCPNLTQTSNFQSNSTIKSNFLQPNYSLYSFNNNPNPNLNANLNFLPTNNFFSGSTRPLITPSKMTTSFPLINFNNFQRTQNLPFNQNLLFSTTNPFDQFNQAKTTNFPQNQFTNTYSNRQNYVNSLFTSSVPQNFPITNYSNQNQNQHFNPLRMNFGFNFPQGKVIKTKLFYFNFKQNNFLDERNYYTNLHKLCHNAPLDDIEKTERTLIEKFCYCHKTKIVVLGPKEEREETFMFCSEECYKLFNLSNSDN